jgi:hypothetical protein
MPDYLQPSVLTSLLSSGLTLDPNFSDTITQNNNSTNCCCPSTTNFLETLTNKLHDMAVSLKKQFEELKAIRASSAKGAIIASINASCAIQIKYEYILYIRRYGPPVNGVFDEDLLTILRSEL